MWSRMKILWYCNQKGIRREEVKEQTKERKSGTKVKQPERPEGNCRENFMHAIAHSLQTVDL